MLDRQNTINNWKAVRLAADAMAISASIATGNPGPLMFLDAAVAGADIVVQVNEDYIESSSNSAELRQFVGEWDQLVAVYGFGRLGVGIATLNYNKIPAYVANIKGNVVAAQQLFKFMGSLSKVQSEAALSRFLEVLYMQTVVEREVMTMHKALRIFDQAVGDFTLSVAQSSDLVVVPAGSTTGLITKSYSIGTASLTEGGGLVLSNPRWLPAAAAAEPIGLLPQISYTAQAAAKQTNGALELVATAEGQVYVREATPYNFFASYKNLRAYLGDGQMKAYLNSQETEYFVSQLRNADQQVLEAINDLDHEVFINQLVREYQLNPKAFEHAIKSLPNLMGQYGWFNYIKVVPRLKPSLETIASLRSQGLLLPIGEATDLQLACIHAFTIDGNLLNTPMRYQPSWMTSYTTAIQAQILEGLQALAKVPDRALPGNKTLMRGMAKSTKDFDQFVSEGIYKEDGFVSMTTDINVAEGFVQQSAQWADGEIVGVILKIKTSKGVNIDDFSDWGIHLGKVRHPDDLPAIQIQSEYLASPGSFRLTSKPVLYKEHNGIKYYLIECE